MKLDLNNMESQEKKYVELKKYLIFTTLVSFMLGMLFSIICTQVSNGWLMFIFGLIGLIGVLAFIVSAILTALVIVDMSDKDNFFR
jgi:F0F1-type ATP synthase assembly protein I